MKRLAISALIAAAASVALTPLAMASGWIVVDPIVGGGMIRPPIHLPPHHPPDVPPGPHHPVLHGNVSFGLHLQSEAVQVEITDQVAKTYITQTFSNDSDATLAGTYLFPLPDDTTFSSFSLMIDGKPVEGKILEAAEARQQYEAIVRQMVDPGLLEYADYKTVRARIFPIPAHGTKKVELEYTQLLKAENGMLRYSFPLKAEENAEPASEIKIGVKLASKQGLRTIWSPSHTIKSERESDNKAKVSYLEQNVLPDKDFLLYYSVSDKDMAANLLNHRTGDEDGYFLLTLSPPLESKQVIAKDIVLITDTSGSMQGAKMEQNKKALNYVIDALNPDDRFDIINFATDADAFKPELMTATADNKKKAHEFVNELEARGGTNISGALSLGSSLLGAASSRPAYIVLMTDGEPTVGETDVQQLLSGVKPKRDIRIFDFGVGYDVNTRLLNKLAEEHHGTSQYVGPDENLETSLGNFYQKIKSPVLSDVKISYDSVQVKDVYPRELKDIFAGSQAILIGKYKGDGKVNLKLTGTVNGAAKEYTFPLEFAKDETGHTYLPRLWAMRRIGHLTEVAQSNGNNREIIDEIVSLSKKYGIISAYTSFLVTDPSEGRRMQPMPMPVRMMRGGGGGDVSMGIPAAPGAMHGVAFGAAAETGSAMPPPVSRGQRFDYAPSSFNADSHSSPVAGRILAMPKEEAASRLQSILGNNKDMGHQAFEAAKSINQLKGSDVVVQDERKSVGIKSIEDKTFYFQDGVWVDSAFDADKSPKVETITFGSKEYFDLMRIDRLMSKYLAAGKQMIVVFKGHCYKIVQPTNGVS